MRIVYHSFGGRYSDNPRAIYETLAASRPGLTQAWLCDPAHAHGFPPAADTVPMGGDPARQALESADVVVSNTHIELDWAKPPGAVYLQTWHGTPLKRIHFDVLWAPPGRLEYLTQDVRRWDYLLSPNSASTAALRGAFGFTGEVLETGYPRNDVLSAPDRDARRDRVRDELCIGPDATVVLYTPTWRDDILGDDGKPDPDRAFALELDVAELTGRLGPGHVLLLRLHYLLSDRLGPVDAPGVLDVSLHSDISDLYLAADVMVTDYSSTMFDFAVTGRPLLFYTYDLDHYRDTLRGFYFDLAAHAPGPMLRTTTELADALSDLEKVRAGYKQEYARFRERFCHLEDGQATARVIHALFPPG